MTDKLRQKFHLLMQNKCSHIIQLTSKKKNWLKKTLPRLAGLARVRAVIWRLFSSASVIYGVFWTSSSFHVKRRTAGRVQFFGCFLLVLTKFLLLGDWALGTGLSFFGVSRLFWYFLISLDHWTTRQATRIYRYYK